MATQSGLKHKYKALKSNKDNSAKKVRTKIKSQSAAPAKVKEKDNRESHKPIIKAAKALKSLHVVEQRSLARNKTPKKSVDVGAERQEQLRRVSFVVRLILERNNQFGRTEIEHVSSNKRQSFLKLDGKNLVDFMRACVGPAIEPKSSNSVVLSPKRAGKSAPDQRNVKLRLVISNIQVFNSRDPNVLRLTLRAEEPFIVHAHFQLQGTEAESLTHQEPFYETTIHVYDIADGQSKVVTTHRATMMQNVLEYMVSIEIPGLSHGLYRLFTVIRLSAENKAVEYHDGPIIQVI